MNNPPNNSQRLSSERGQTFLIIAVFISGFLLVIIGLATDYAQIWAHRQMAQGAADAACEAAAADLFLVDTDPSASTDFPSLNFSWIGAVGSTFDCSTKPSSVPCQYASLNGYSGSNVSVGFPSSLPGVPAIPAGFGAIAHPYVLVSVSDPVPMTFTKLVSAGTFTISAKAGCGLASVITPVPLVILHKTASSSLSVGGSAQITIFGGPQRSIQVDSSSSTAAGVGTVDLHLGGPSGTGSDFGVFGGPTAKPSGVNLGSTGNWLPKASQFGDPFATVTAPASAPATAGAVTPVPFGMNGCPDPIGCAEFAAGDYTGCSTGNFAPGGKGCLTLPYTGSNPQFSAGGTDWQASHAYTVGTLIVPATNNSNNSMFKVTIAGTSGPTQPATWLQTACARQSDGTCTGGTITNGGATFQNLGVVTLKPVTAIFDPGLYYLVGGGLNLGSNSSVRISTAAGDGSGGATFYFTTSASVAVTSNSGKSSACTSASSGSATPNDCLVSYKVNGTVSTAATGYVPSPNLKCPTGSDVPSQVPALVDGNILLGPCSGTYSSPDGNRGFLFFQKRSVAAQPSWGGGGQFLSSGFLYFHNGNGANCGTNTSCLTLQGNSGSGSYTLGNVVVDKLALGGTPDIKMILNPTATFSILRPTLLE